MTRKVSMLHPVGLAAGAVLASWLTAGAAYAEQKTATPPPKPVMASKTLNVKSNQPMLQSKSATDRTVTRGKTLAAPSGRARNLETAKIHAPARTAKSSIESISTQKPARLNSEAPSVPAASDKSDSTTNEVKEKKPETPEERAKRLGLSGPDDPPPQPQVPVAGTGDVKPDGGGTGDKGTGDKSNGTGDKGTGGDKGDGKPTNTAAVKSGDDDGYLTGDEPAKPKAPGPKLPPKEVKPGGSKSPGGKTAKAPDHPAGPSTAVTTTKDANGTTTTTTVTNSPDGTRTITIVETGEGGQPLGPPQTVYKDPSGNIIPKPPAPKPPAKKKPEVADGKPESKPAKPKAATKDDDDLLEGN